MCKFGDSIKSLRWVEWGNPETKLNDISRFCAGIMDELDVGTERLTCDDSLRPLLSSLKTLALDCGSFTGDAGRLFSGCQELKILRLTRVPYTESTEIPGVAQKYGRLEELHIGDRLWLKVRTTIVLLEINLNIKKLDMFDDDANRTIYAFASKMHGLEVLVLRHKRERNCFKNVTELASLKSLKVLELHGVGPDFVAAIEAMESVPIERFKWDKLKSLKSLALPGISLPLGGSLAELIEQLPLLHELELGFKNLNVPVRYIFELVERFPKLGALAIHTDHPQLFDQQFYDALLEVILRRRSSFNLLSPWCNASSADAPAANTIFLGYENDSLGHYLRFELAERPVVAIVVDKR